MCNQQDIRRVLAVHVVLVHRANLLNEVIKTVRHLLRRPVLTWSDILDRRGLDINSKESFLFKKNNLLSILATVSPDIPLALGIQTVLFSQGPDLFSQQTFIQTVVPLGQSVGFRDLLCIFKRLLIGIRESNLKGLHCSPARTDVDMGKLSRVNQSAGSDNHLARCIDLVDTILGELKLSDSGVPSVLGPFRLP